MASRVPRHGLLHKTSPNLRKVLFSRHSSQSVASVSSSSDDTRRDPDQLLWIQIKENGEKAKDNKVPLMYCASDTVIDIYIAINRQYNIPYNQQTLVYKDQVLQEDRQIAEYNIRPQESIQCLLKDTYRSKIDYNESNRRFLATLQMKARLSDAARRLRKAYHVVLAVVKIRYLTYKTFQAPQLVPRKISTGGTRASVCPVLIESAQAKAQRDELIQLLKIEPSRRTTENTQKIYQWMQTLEWLETCSVSKPALLQVARHLTYEAHPCGTYVFQQGDPGHKFYIVLRGSIIIAAERLGRVAHLYPGSHFGEIALMRSGVESLRTGSAIVDFPHANLHNENETCAELAVINKSTYRKSLYGAQTSSLEEKKKMLVQIPMFATIPFADITTIVYTCRIQDAEGARILCENTLESDSIYFVVKGQLKIRVDFQFDTQPLVYLVSAPYVFGESCCFAPYDVIQMATPHLHDIPSSIDPVENVFRFTVSVTSISSVKMLKLSSTRAKSVVSMFPDLNAPLYASLEKKFEMYAFRRNASKHIDFSDIDALDHLEEDDENENELTLDSSSSESEAEIQQHRIVSRTPSFFTTLPDRPTSVDAKSKSASTKPRGFNSSDSIRAPSSTRIRSARFKSTGAAERNTKSSGVRQVMASWRLPTLRSKKN